jgi:hypothetical protein
MTYMVFHISTATISFPEHACSQVKGRFSSGEIELIQACDWLAADSTLEIREILKLFRITHRKFETFYTETDWKQLEILVEICTKALDGKTAPKTQSWIEFWNSIFSSKDSVQ